MPSKSTRSKSKGKSHSTADKLIGWLQVIQQHPQGVVLCAPKSKKDTVVALNYSATGKLTKAQRDQYERYQLFDFIEGLGTCTIQFVYGKKNTSRELTATLYGLNQAGQERLQAHEKELIEEPLQQLNEQIQQLVSTRREISTQLDIIEGVFKGLVQAGDTIVGQLQQTFQEQQKEMQTRLQMVNELFQNLPQLPLRLGKLRQQLQIPLTKTILASSDSEWQACWNQLQAPMEQIRQILASKDIAPALDKIKSLAQTLQKLTQQMPSWERYIADSLQNWLKEDSGAPATSVHGRRQGGFDLRPASEVCEFVLKHISNDWIEIPQLYQNMSAQGLEAGRGAFNDILLQLKQDGKIHIRPWAYPLSQIPHPQHAIVMADMEVFYYVRRVL